MRLRVVCGFDVTIATFCPTKRLMSVDLPAFGRPTIATNPDLCFFFSLFPAASTFSALSVECFFFAIRLLYHRQLQRARMFRVMEQRDVCRLRILPGLLRHDSAAVIILLDARRIRAMHQQPQPA